MQYDALLYRHFLPTLMHNQHPIPPLFDQKEILKSIIWVNVWNYGHHPSFELLIPCLIAIACVTGTNITVQRLHEGFKLLYSIIDMYLFLCFFINGTWAECFIFQHFFHNLYLFLMVVGCAVLHIESLSTDSVLTMCNSPSAKPQSGWCI